MTWIRHGCQSASFTPDTGVRVWRWPEFDLGGQPVAGAWGEAVRADGCGIARVLNVLTYVRTAGALVSGPLAPGDTTADPTLQRDASQHAFTAALTHVPGCRQAYLDDTRFVSRTAPARPDPRLTGPVTLEHWTVIACGTPVVVDVQFLPVGHGTDIVARAP